MTTGAVETNKVVAWMDEKHAWQGLRAPTEPGLYALVLADDLEAERAAREAAESRSEVLSRSLRTAHAEISKPAARADHYESALAAMRAQCEGLAKDAARYRWLRERDWWNGPLAVVVNPKEAINLGHDSPSRRRLDEAIDAAREATP